MIWAVLLLPVNARTHDVLDHGLDCVGGWGGVCGYATYCWGDAAILFVNLKCLHLNHMLLISVRGGRNCLRQVRYVTPVCLATTPKRYVTSVTGGPDRIEAHHVPHIVACDECVGAYALI